MAPNIVFNLTYLGVTDLAFASSAPPKTQVKTAFYPLAGARTAHLQLARAIRGAESIDICPIVSEPERKDVVMKGKMLGLAKILSIFFFLVGLVLFVVPFFHPDSEVKLNFSGKMASLADLSDLGSYLSGTAGILLTISSVIFLYISIQLTLDAMTRQEADSEFERRSQMIRDFEQLFFFMCEDIDRIKGRFANYERKVGDFFQKYSPVRDQEILLDRESGELEKQIRENETIRSIDSLILHISGLVDTVLTRMDPKDESLIGFYLRMVSYRLSREELRVFQIVSMTSALGGKVGELLSRLDYRSYEISTEMSKERQATLEREAEIRQLLAKKRWARWEL